MPVKEGLNIGERQLYSTRAKYVIGKPSIIGPGTAQLLGGELVLTQKGVVFLVAKGLFRMGRSRHHYYEYDQIAGIRTESKGIMGALSGTRFVAIDVRMPQGIQTFRYSCRSGDAETLCRGITRQLRRKVADIELRQELLRLIKPAGKVNLQEIAHNPSVKNLVGKIVGAPPTHVPVDRLMSIVTDMVRSLISTGDLDGVIDEDNNYVSSLILSRKSVQYHVTIDFVTLQSQLKGKGIILETIECPSCKGKLKMPSEGSMIVCEYCGATVTAIDIFEKFKAILDV